MRTRGLCHGGARPLGVVLPFVLPLAGAAVALAAGASSVPEAPDSDLPGLDVLGVVVPGGELAGRALQVSEVASRLDATHLLDRIEHAWRGEHGASVVRAHSGPWSLLSRQVGDGFETLQLRPSHAGGSEGWLARWGGARARPHAPGSLTYLLPDDARVARQLTSRDAVSRSGGDRDAGARTADTLLGQLPHSIDEAERRIDAHLRRAGFSPDRRTAPARSGPASRDDRARFYRARGADVLVTLHAQAQGTGFVLYHVRLSP